jgi:cytochrome c-type biogenesis protein CcmH/NrfF
MQRHPADPVSLVAGAIFAVAGVLLLADRLDVLAQARWVLPLLLIVIAVVMLVSVSPRRREESDAGADTPES